MAKRESSQPSLIILNQMAGPLTWELGEDIGAAVGKVAILTGHPDTLSKGSNQFVELFPSVAYVKGSFVKRVFRWIRYSIHMFLWLWRWPRKTPVLVFSNPPIGPWAVWVVSLLRGTPYGVMIHDIYPDVAERMGVLKPTSLPSRIWRFFNRRAYNKANLVMTLGDHMAEVIAQQFSLDKTKYGSIVVVPPWADTEFIKPLRKSENRFAIEHNQVDKVTVLYSGNMGIGHDIETILDAAEKLKDESRIHFMLIGLGPKWEVAREQKSVRKLNNLTVLPWQPESELPYTMSTADIALVSLETEMAGVAIPSRTYVHLAAGTAIIVISGAESEITSLAIHGQCGRHVMPGDSLTLAEAISEFAKNPSVLSKTRSIARETAERDFSRQNSNQLVSALVASNLVSQDDFLQAK
jgi:glycosyltransferase involved in cell wall biosynthesis